MQTHELLILALCAACVVLAWGWLRAHTRVRRHNRRRQRIAARGEAGAEELLVAAGYRVVERQVTGQWTLVVDGEPVEVRCRADLIAERRGRRVVAEVKTGDRVTDPTHPQTRRQLLEYGIAFEVDEVLLVDMHAGAIRRVEVGRLLT